MVRVFIGYKFLGVKFFLNWKPIFVSKVMPEFFGLQKTSLPIGVMKVKACQDEKIRRVFWVTVVS